MSKRYVGRGCEELLAIVMGESCGELARVDGRQFDVLPLPAKMRGRPDPYAPLLLACFVACALVGCAPQDGTGSSGGTSASGGGTSGSSGDGGAMTTAGKACVDTAAAFATAAKRCGGNYDAEYAAFVRDLAGGDCNSVSIRNESELRYKCFPSLARIPCADLKQMRFDPSCAEQIIRSK